MTQTFKEWEEHLDPDAPLGKHFVVDITLPPGDSLATADIDVVDAKSKTVDPDPDTDITEVAFALIDAVSNKWGVSFKAQGGDTAAEDDYWLYLRCRFTTTNGEGDDITGRLLIAQG